MASKKWQPRRGPAGLPRLPGGRRGSAGGRLGGSGGREGGRGAGAGSGHFDLFRADRQQRLSSNANFHDEEHVNPRPLSSAVRKEEIVF